MKIIPAKRVSRTYTQHLTGSPEAVFPLLCPVREADSIQGWDALLGVSDSGVAELDCAFVTAALPSNAVWYITRHEPADGFVEMLKLTPGVTACRLSIQLRAVGGAGLLRWFAPGAERACQFAGGAAREHKAPWPFWFEFGVPNMGGPLVTASGLVFIAATTDDFLRAFDLTSAKPLWKARLPAGGQSSPMSYAIDGRQYIVIAAGGHGGMETTRGDHLVAFALKR